jgi:hypothetical protein
MLYVLSYGSGSRAAEFDRNLPRLPHAHLEGTPRVRNCAGNLRQSAAASQQPLRLVKFRGGMVQERAFEFAKRRTEGYFPGVVSGSPLWLSW